MELSHWVLQGLRRDAAVEVLGRLVEPVGSEGFGKEVFEAHFAGSCGCTVVRV